MPSKEDQMSNLHIPMSAPDITLANIDAVNAVLHTPVLSIGPAVLFTDAAGAGIVIRSD